MTGPGAALNMITRAFAEAAERANARYPIGDFP